MKISVQQALYHHFVQPVRRIAGLAAINPRTAWNHIHAGQKSKVKPWANRSSSERDAAIAEADKIVKALPPVPISIKRRRIGTGRARIPAGPLHAMIDAEITKRVGADDTFTAYSVTKVLRALNPGNDVVHKEVQARVRYVMESYSSYEMVFENWNGMKARTWRPKQSAAAGQAVPAHQRLWECEFCGTKDVKGAACTNCGAPRADDD